MSRTRALVALLLTVGLAAGTSAATSVAIRGQFLFSTGVELGDVDRLTMPEDVCLDLQRREIYIVDSGSQRIQVMDEEGSLLASFNVPEIADTGGVAVDSQGYLYLTSRKVPRIRVLDNQGRLVDNLDLSGAEEKLGPLEMGHLAQAGGNRLAVVCAAPGRVLVLKLPGGEVERVVGEIRRADGVPLGTLLDVAVDGQGRYHLLDTEPTRVAVFDASGRFQFQYGEPGGGKHKLGLPRALDRVSERWMGVLDSTRSVLLVFDEKGEVLGEFGQQGNHPGTWMFPTAMRADPVTRRVFSVEISPGRVQAFQVL